MVFLCSCSSSSFMNWLVHALISLPAHSGRIGAQAVSLWKKSGGGGGARVFWSFKGWFI